jgi:hypothetical protein
LPYSLDSSSRLRSCIVPKRVNFVSNIVDGDGVVCWKVALVDFEYAKAFDSIEPSTYSSGQQFPLAQGTDFHRIKGFDELVVLSGCGSDHVQVMFLDHPVPVLIGRRGLVHRIPSKSAMSFSGLSCIRQGRNNVLFWLLGTSICVDLR